MPSKNTQNLLWFGITAVVLAQLLGAIGIVASPLDALIKAWQTEFALTILVGYFFAYFAVAYFSSGPGKREAMVVAGVGLVLLLACVAMTGTAPQGDVGIWYYAALAGVSFGLPATVVLCLALKGDEARRATSTNLLGVGIFVVLVSMAGKAFLDLTSALSPATQDLKLFHFDRLSGFSPSVAVGVLFSEHAWLKRICQIVYNIGPLTFVFLFARQLLVKHERVINILNVWAVGTVLALIAYQLYPVAGPVYAFGGNIFPLAMPPLDAIPMEAVILDPAARNGMPSMHLGWALAAMLVTMLMRNRGLIVSYALIAVFTFLATLGLGEHYLIDLVVALPFNLAVVAMCIANGAMDSRLRRKIIAFGLGTWLLWIVLLRFAFPLFILFPPLAWVLVLLTVIASVWFSMRLVKAVASAETMSSPALDAVPTSADAGQPLLLVLCMFFLSGFAALMYEVVFSKQLALTFGSTSTAAYTVLSVYMGGMALGGWIGGRLAERAGSALRMYAGIEFIIGSYCAITPFIFVFCRWLYVTLAIDLPPDAGYLTVLRLVLGATALLIPTMLMGMTLPVLASAINKGRQGWGRAIGLLYGANTLGAALGALLAGYAILSTIGLTKTILTAAILNVIVAAIALRMHSRNALGEPSAAAASHVEPEADHEQPGPRLALLQLMLIGFVTLALEVVYFHLLAVVAGNSAYAFALMLFSFLIGLGGGAELGRRLLAALKMPALIVYIQIALGLVIALGLLGWEAIPGYFADFESYPLTRSFGARELVRGLVCFAVMVPPALLIGMLYPMLMHYVGSARQSGGVRAVGRATALNTLGNISGVLVAAFVLLPMVGSFRSVLLLAGLAIVAAATVAFSMKRARVAVAGAAMAGAVFVAVMPGQFDLDELASGANVYFARMDFGKTIDASESPDGGLTSVVQRPGKDGLKTLLTNGKFQGTDSFAGEMVAQIGIAVAPLLHTDKRDNALVIGYGTGATTRALHDAGFKSLDVAELSGDVVKLANRHFERVNSRVTEQKGVRTFVTDGRNFLMLTSAKYDVISIELSSIWFAGAAALYNSDFYTIARAKLKDDGVLQQWVQLHHLSPIDIVYIIGSARTQFKYVTLYAIGGQGVLVLTNDATRIATAANAQLLEQTPGMRELVNAFGGHIRNMNEQLILSPEATDRLLTASGQPMSYWQSTDDNSLLEYSTPRGNAAANAQSMEANIAFLRANSGAR